MAAKSTGYCGKILAAFFTSVLAPLLVHLVEQDIPLELLGTNRETVAPSTGASADRSSAPCRAFLDARSSRAPSTPLGAEVVHVVALGVGRSPEASLHDALRTALCQVIRARNEANCRARIDRIVSESLYREAGGFLLGWQEIETRSEWRLTGMVYYKKVAVKINGRALAERFMPMSLFAWDSMTSPLP